MMQIVFVLLVSSSLVKVRVDFNRSFSLEYFFRGRSRVLWNWSQHFYLFSHLFLHRIVIFFEFIGRSLLKCKSEITFIFWNYIKIWNFLSFKFVNLIHSSSRLHIMNHTESICNIDFSQPSFEFLVSPQSPLRNSFTLSFSNISIWHLRAWFTSEISYLPFYFVLVIPFFWLLLWILQTRYLTTFGIHKRCFWYILHHVHCTKVINDSTPFVCH